MPTSAKPKKAAAKAAPAKPATKSAAAPALAAGLKKSDHVFLVDGSGYIFRAYHAIRFQDQTKKLTPTQISVPASATT